MFETLQQGIEFLRSQALGNAPSELQLYVPLQGTRTGGYKEEPFDLQTGIRQFLNIDAGLDGRANHSKVLLLLGETGSGKSVFCQDFYRHLWQRYQPGQAIPLWLPLPHLKNPFEEAVDEILLEAGFDKAQIAQLQQQERFIFIADGYDELHSFQNLYVSNHWETWQAKVIIACRSQALYHVGDYERHFMPFESGERRPWLLDKLFVAPFSEQQIDAYLLQYHERRYRKTDDPDEDVSKTAKRKTKRQSKLTHTTIITQAQLKAVPGLASLITTPFLLHLAVEALPDILKRYQHKDAGEQIKMTQADLYDVFIERWFKRQEVKLRKTNHLKENDEDIKPKLWKYCKNLAKQMHAADVTHIEIKQDAGKRKLFAKQTQATQWASFFNAEFEFIRAACPLRQWGENQYGFIHASLIEYFATRAMYDDSLQEAPQPANHSTAGMLVESLHASDAKLQGGIHQRIFATEPNAIRFLADRILLNTAFKTKMLAYIEGSKTDSRYAIGAANAITALNRAEIGFSGMNFKGIRIADAYLPNVLMDSTDLSDADLTGVHLQNACLVNANFTGAKMSDVTFGEKAYFKTSSSVSSISISQDESKLAIAYHNLIEIWDLQKGVQLGNPLEGHENKITCVTFSPDGMFLASASWDNTVGLWDLGKLQPLVGFLRRHAMSVNSVCFSPDSKTIASGSNDKTICLWDVATQKPLSEPLTGHDFWVTSVAFSPNGKVIASGSCDYSIRLWDASTRTLLRVLNKGHSRAITNLSFSPNGEMLATSSEDLHIQLWEVATGQPLKRLSGGHQNTITSISFSPDGKLIASGSLDHTIRLWDVATATLAGEAISGHIEGVTSIVFTPKGKMLLSGSKDKTVRRWIVDTSQMTNRESPQSHVDSVNCVAFSPDGKILASGSDDKTIRLWDTTTGSAFGEPLIGHHQAVTALGFSTDGKMLISGSADTSLQRWEVLTQKQLGLALKGHRARVKCMAISPNGKMLASGGMDDKIQLWDRESGDTLMTLQGHSSTVIGLAFKQDMSLVSTCTSNIIQWDTTTGAILATFSHSDIHDIISLAVAPNGTQIATSTTNKIVLWNAKTHQKNATLPALHTDTINCLAFSPDNQHLASGSQDQTIRLWNTTSNLTVGHPLQGHMDGITSMAFAQHNLLASGSRDYTLRLWRPAVSNFNHWYCTWRSRPYVLQVFGAALNLANSLSEDNQTLLAQRGANPILRDHTSITKDSLENDEHNSSLYDAARNGQVDTVKALLKTKVPVDIGREDWTPLMVAACEGHAKVVSLLLTNGAVANQANDNGATALYIAAEQGHTEVVSCLLKSGTVAVNHADKKGFTPLLIATQRGHAEIVSLLLKNGAAVDQAEKNGITPLLIATQSGHAEIVSLLLKFDAVVNQTYLNLTPLCCAVINGNLEVVSLLLENNATIDPTNEDITTPLFIAAQHGHAEAISLLLKNGAAVNQANKEGLTPLHVTAGNGHTEVVSLLLQNGAAVNQATKQGTIPLYIAAQQGHVKTISLLLKNGAAVNQATQDGTTPLFIAAQQGHAEAVSLLLKNGADANQATKDGFTPLHAAAGNGHIEVVSLLLKNGAVVSQANDNGATPLWLASREGHTEVVSLLIKNDADVNHAHQSGLTPLCVAVHNGHVEIVILLLKKSASVDLAEENGITPLYIAAQNGHTEFVSLLLKNGAAVNQAQKDGSTPLDIAITKGHHEVVNILREHQGKTKAVLQENEQAKTKLSESKEKDDVDRNISGLITPLKQLGLFKTVEEQQTLQREIIEHPTKPCCRCSIL